MKNFFKSILGLLSISTAVTLTAQVPILNSDPAAPAVIFLDFDGQTVTGTSWNYNGPIYCGAAGLDSTKITKIFNRVAEDYRPFNVNVTTDSTKYFAAPATKRMRAILTVTSEWYGSAGGVAFVGSFIWGDNTPCFIFTALLGNSTKNIAEASSHEVGHTLGLYHQSAYDSNCVKTSDYNYGVGSGEIGWAPIMGAGYYKNLTQWNNGPNSFGCTNYQNDLDVITTYAGLSYRTDDHASTFASAPTINFTANQFSVNGEIEKNTDQDMIKFTLPGIGNLTIDAIPYNVGTGNSGSNLDIQATLYSSSQTELGVYNPESLLSTQIDTLLDPGTYYLKVEGKGNIYAPNYASLGSYTISGTYSAGNPLPLRRLELTGQVNGELHNLNWLIDADEQVVEQSLDYSTDGRNFNPMATPGVRDRSFGYKPLSAGKILYRLRVKFDNGKQYVSNIITLRNSTGPKPQLQGNFIYGNNIVISSPGNFNYTIMDITGKIAGEGKLTNGINNLSVSFVTGGMYMIRYTNGSDQWTDKFVRH